MKAITLYIPIIGIILILHGAFTDTDKYVDFNLLEKSFIYMFTTAATQAFSIIYLVTYFT